MDEKTYLAQRIDDQINWYEKKSKFNQDRYKLSKTIVIITSVSIPFLAGLIEGGNDILKIIVGIAGVVIAAIEGIMSLHKYQDLWLQYRMSAEMLRREKIIYSTKSGVYANNPNAFKEFVKRAEAIMSGENQSWVEKQQEEKGDEE